MRPSAVILSALALAALSLQAKAALLIKVDQSTQRMTVDVDGLRTFEWQVSTGKPGFDTPGGVFRPNRLDADHYSDEYNSAPMPFSIFFDLKGHAIHGTYEPIGRPGASHGCVRLSPANASKLFSLVQAHGLNKTRIEIEGDVRVALRNTKATKVARQKAPVVDPAMEGGVYEWSSPTTIRIPVGDSSIYGLY